MRFEVSVGSDEGRLPVRRDPARARQGEPPYPRTMPIVRILLNRLTVSTATGALALASLTACSGADPATTPSQATPPAASAGVYSTDVGDLDAVVRLLAHPINYSAMEHSPNEGDWSHPLDEAGFEALADAGFTAVRLPVRFSAHQSLAAPYTLDESFLERLDWAIDQALSHGLAIIIDNHHWGVEGSDDLDALFDDPEGQKARLEAIWEQVATRYADQPAGVVFEILNEPHGALDAYWNEYQGDVLDIIRESNPDRAVVVSPITWSNPWALATLDLPDDDHLIATFHNYTPFEFTHQGATWIYPVPPVGVEWPASTLRLSDAWSDWSWGTTVSFTATGAKVKAEFSGAGIMLHRAVPIPAVESITLTTTTPVEYWIDCRTGEEVEQIDLAHFTTAANRPYTFSTASCGLGSADLQDIRIILGDATPLSYTLSDVSLSTDSKTWSVFVTPQEQVTDQFDFAAEWSAAHGDIPVLMGEWGTSEFGDRLSRTRWVRTTVEEAEARGILTAYWDFQGTWGFWTPEDGITQKWLAEAILGDHN
jgi:endoglucanase